MTVKKISKQEAIDKGLFGPVYHGTHETARDAISREGFKIHIGSERSGDVSHGYQASSYAGGKPAPVHHLGYGVYFTTVKSIAKSFNGGSEKGLKEYYLDIPRLETINFGSQSNMMKWWVQNGYDIPTIYPLSPNMPASEVARLRVEATKNLTDKLKSKWDAVWFKGKGMYKLLDGDQIAVFDPSRIYEVDKALAKDFDVGGKVRRKSDGMLGVIVQVQDAAKMLKDYPGASTWVRPETKKIFGVRWQKGGTAYNVQDGDVEAVPPKGFKKEVSSRYDIVADAERKVLVYHASHQDITELKERPLTNFDTLGTWFDEDPKMARKLYGPKVFEFELPEADFLEVEESTNGFLSDDELIEKHWDKKALKRFKELAKQGDYAESMGDEDGVKEAIKSMQRIFEDQVYRNPAYLKAFRAQIEKNGWHGIKFVNSTIDTGPGERHTVYVLFKHPPLHPIQKVIGAEPAKINFRAKVAGQYLLPNPHPWDQYKSLPSAEPVVVPDKVYPTDALSAPPTEDLKKQVFYHGTPSKKRADKLWKDGIKPDLSENKGLGRPVEGRVYITKNLGYALHYALGAAVAGTDSDYTQKLIKEFGQYGFIAVVPGEQLADLHPDEDQVGEAVHDAFKHNSSRWLKELAEEHLYVEAVDPEYHDNLLDQVKSGDYDAYIAAGKILLPELTDEQKLEIIEEYGNVAHQGMVKASELWRIDRNKIPELEKNGSNFFKLAEKIK